MARQQWEKDLLKELEGLDYLNKLFQGFDDLLSQAIEEYDTLDPNLRTILESIRFDVNLTLNGVVVVKGKKVEGIIKQFADVQDEVLTLQAGMATKQGIPLEDTEDTEEE